MALATVFALRTVASAKPANKFETAANIETFDAKGRCPAKKIVDFTIVDVYCEMPYGS